MDIYKQFFNKNASEKRLVTVGRMTSVCALILALIAVYPIMGSADQAFQVIQEYSGFVYPGVVVIFGLGLLWKRASGVAAVVTAIGTFVFSILFKFMMPDTPFLLRMGYVFVCLCILFFGLSFLSKNTIPAKEQELWAIKKQLKWSDRMFYLTFIALVIGIWGMMKVELRAYGFEAMFFLASMFFALSIYLRSNAKDKIQDPKAVDIDLKLFRTDSAFKIGAYGVILILAILYIALW